MPYKRNYRRKPRKTKKRFVRKKVSTLGRPSYGLRTSEYKFRRQKRIHFNIGGNLPPEWNSVTDTDNCIYNEWAFHAASDVSGWPEFAQLFRQYKLDAVKLEFYPDINTVTTNRLNPQMMMVTIPTRHGYAPVTRAAMEQHQSMRKQIIFSNKQPLSIYMKLNQASCIYSLQEGIAPTYTDYVKSKPRFIASEEDHAEHYGFATYIMSVNETALVWAPGTTPVPFQPFAVTMWQTVYLTMKEVA